MGLRETLNAKPAITTGATVGLIVIAIVVIVWQILPSRGGGAEGVRKAYYSDDDGKTWFEDDLYKVTPFKSKNGKDAVRAHVFKIGDNKPFVQFLERFKPEVKEKLEKQVADPANKGVVFPEFRDESMKWYKKPGANSKWAVGSFQTLNQLRAVEKDGVFGLEIWPQAE